MRRTVTHEATDVRIQESTEVTARDSVVVELRDTLVETTTITIDRKTCDTLYNLLGAREVGLLRLPVIDTMTGHLMTFVDDTPHHLWSMLGKVTRTEECGTHAVLLQHIEDAAGANLRNGHTLFQGEVNTMFARYIELFCIKT